jgi:hypothetical protein
LPNNLGSLVGSDIISLRPGRSFLVLPLVKILPVGCVVLFLAVRVLRVLGAAGLLDVGMEIVGLVLDLGAVSAEVFLAGLAVPW